MIALFSLIVSIIFAIEAFILLYITTNRLFKTDKDFMPILLQWSKSFTYLFFSAFFTLLYVIISTILKTDLASQFGGIRWSIHFVFTVSVNAFQAFACFEFFKTTLIIRNSINIKRLYLSKKQGYFTDIISHTIYALSLFFLGVLYLPYENSSILFMSQVTGFRFFDGSVNVILFVSYFIQFFLIKSKQNHIYTSIKYVFLLLSLKHILQTINILFFSESFYRITSHIEWVPVIIAIGALDYYFIKQTYGTKKEESKTPLK